jgi:pyruvate dehydrogenase E2 component (dihydrolipoamide acetyltransferase)
MTSLAGTRRMEPTRLQQTIARRMSASHADVPDFSLQVDVDMEPAVRWRSDQEREGKWVPSYNDMVVRACAKALCRNPRANGSWVEGTFEFHEAVNVGVAVAAPGALMVPVVRHADRRTLAEIGREVRRLAGAVKDGTIRLEDLSNGTFTVSNLGMFGVDRFIATVNPPQAAIIAVGALAKRAVVVDGAVAVRPTITLTLSCDHRILYGADGAGFLDDVRRELENPTSLDDAPAAPLPLIGGQGS